MVSLPQRLTDVLLTPVDDGFLATREGSDVITWLNRTSAMILELCTGHNEPAVIAQAVKEAFDLSWDPEPAVRTAIGELVAAGLAVTSDAMNTSEFNVLIAVWAPEHSVHVDVLSGIEKLRNAARANGVTTNLFTDSHRSLRSAKNRTAAIMLANPGMTHVLFLDATQEAIHAMSGVSLLRLLESGHDVLGVPVQHGEERWALIRALGESVKDVDSETYRALSRGFCVTFGGLPGSRKIVDGFIEARAVGSQALLVSRSALERIAGSHNCQRARGVASHGTVEIVPRWGFFDSFISSDGLDIDEETAFCERWRAIGGKVMVDATGSLGKSLEAAQAISRARKKQ